MKNFIKYSLLALGLLMAAVTNISAQNDTLCNPNEIAKYKGELYLNYGSVSNAYSQYNRSSYSLGQPLITPIIMQSQQYQIGFGVWMPWLLPPSPPTFSASQGEFKDKIKLTWSVNPLSPEPTSFILYRDGSYLAELSPEVRNYLDLFTQAGEFYDYSIVAKNSYGEGAPANSVGFMNPNGVVSGKVETNAGNPVPDVEVRLTPLTGSSLFFDGIDDQLCISYSDSLPTNEFTLSAYVKLGTGNDESGIIDMGSSLNKNWWITTTASGEAKGFKFHIGNGTGSQVISYALPTANGNAEKWHQISMTYKNGSMTVFVDGEFIESKSSANISIEKNYFNIGSKIGASAFFNGKIDDVRMYDRALSQSEIMGSKNRSISKTEDGVVAYWKMDEGIGVKAFDNSINEMDAEIYGGASFSTDIPQVYSSGITDVTGYYSIDGINYSSIESFRAQPYKNFYSNTGLEFSAAENSYVDLTDFAIPDTSTIAVSFNVFDIEGYKAILSKGPNVLQIYIQNGKLRLTISNGGWEVCPITTGLHNVSITIDRVNFRYIIYLDGVEKLNSPIYYPSTVWSGEPWILGKKLSNNNNNFTGIIDELVIYKGLLPQSDIQENITLGTDESDPRIFSHYALNEAAGSKVYDYAAVNTELGAAREGTIYNATWSTNVGSGDVSAHEFEPNIRVVNLNTSNTAVGNVDFKDVSTVNVSGTVRFNNTFCFEDQVEILVNNESHFPPIFTDANGKWTADFEPGATVKLKAVYKDHLFTPGFMEFRKLQAPKAGIVFLDDTKRTIRGQLAGGLCRKSIIPDAGNVVVKVATLDGCFTKTDTIKSPDGKFVFTDLPARAFSVTVEEHPVSPIFSQLALKGAEVDLRDVAADTVDFIYFAPPNIELQPFPLALCGGANLPIPIITQSESAQSAKYKKKIRVYEQYGFDNLPSDRCYLDNAVLTINNAIQGSNEEVIQMDSTTYVYQFLAGVPNIISPYTKTLDVRANVNGGAVTKTEDVIVLGRRSRETTFTTDAPSDKPLWILRDPPGDASYSTLESGSTKCEVYGNSKTSNLGGSLSGSVEIGKKVTTFMGLGAGIIETNGVVTTMGMTGSVNYQGGSTGETEVCYTTTNSYSTSQGDDVVGRMADVFIGTSMNFEYGVNDIIYLDTATCLIADTVNVFVDPKKFGTEYVYSRFQIMNDVIPSLELLESQNPSEDYDEQVARWKKILQEDEYYLKPKQAPSSAISDIINAVLDVIPLSEVIPTDLISDATGLIETTFDFATPGLEFSAGPAQGPDTIRYVPVFDKNVTFDGLSNYTSTFSKSDKRTTTTRWSLGGEFKTNIDTEITIFSIDVGTKIETTTGANYESTSGNSSEKTTTISYTLADDDVGDNFTIDISKKGNMPIFGLKAGESSCPWEYGTLNIEEVGVRADALSQVNVPANVQATFPIHLQNIGQTGADPMVVLIGAVASSNPNGAIMSINGTTLTQPLTFQIDANDELDLLLTIDKGPTEFNYNDLKIFLTTECQYEHSLSLGYILADGLGYLVDETGIIPGFDATKYDGLNEKFYKELAFDVSFIEPCSAVDISFPQQNFVVTPGSNNELSITIDEYDKNDADLEKITLFYRPEGAASWIKIEEILKADLGPTFTTYTWNTALLKDGTYDIKAVTQCTNVALAPGESTVIRGKLERQPPVMVGVPQPSDGLWDPGDEISITFDEPLSCANIVQADVISNNTIGLYDATTDALVDATITCTGNKIYIVPNINPVFFENRGFRVEISGISSNAAAALRDKAGNKIANDISWEFNVNQNSLEWVGTDVHVSNTVFEPYSINRQIRNRGGTIVNFRMESVPSWLTITPSTGALNPGQVGDVTLTFQEDLLIGDYLDTIQLVSSQGSESLLIDYKVRCAPPTWAVADIGSYEGTMSMVVSLDIFGEKSIDPSDIIIAKIDGEIRGVGNIAYYRQLNNGLGEWLSFMTIFGNEADADKEIDFNVWDGSECAEFAEVLETITYNSGDLVGSPISPQVLHVRNILQKCVPLNRGWNWISFNLDMLDNSVTNVLSSLSTKPNALIKSSSQFSKYYDGLGWQHTLDTLRPENRYLLYVTAKDTVCLKGEPYDVALHPITINTGWNWIGYLPQTGVSVTEALKGLTPLNGDLIKNQTHFAQFVAGIGWIGSLNYMDATKAYLLKISNAGTLNYAQANVSTVFDVTDPKGEPLLKFGSGKEIAGTEVIEPELDYNFSKYSANMNSIAVVNGIDVTADDELRAYINGELVGFGKSGYYSVTGQRLFYSTIYHEDEEVINFKIFKADRNKEYDLIEKITFQSNSISGMVNTPLVLNLAILFAEDVAISIPNQVIETPASAFSPVSIPNGITSATTCSNFGFSSILPTGTETVPATPAISGFEANMIGTVKTMFNEKSSFVTLNDKMIFKRASDSLVVGYGIPKDYAGSIYFDFVAGGDNSSTKVPLDVYYYSDDKKQTLALTNGLNYKKDTIYGDLITPSILDFSPLTVNIDGSGVITATINNPDWIGEYCTTAIALNCAGFNDGSTTFCFKREKGLICVSSINLTGPGTETEDLKYRAESITSDATLPTGIKVEYRGGNSILLTEGFETVPGVGSVFIGTIEGCINVE